jgi:hypothetical protein
MQVLPRAFKPVMDRLFRLPTTGTRQAFGSANQIKVDFPRLRLEPNVLHFPRRLQTQGNGKQGRRVHGVSFRHQIHREVKINGSSTLFRTAPENPQTIAQAAHWLKIQLLPQELQVIYETPRDNLFLLHFGVGGGIRTKLRLWGESFRELPRPGYAAQDVASF